MKRSTVVDLKFIDEITSTVEFEQKKKGWTIRLAEEYGVDRQTISKVSRIVNGTLPYPKRSSDEVRAEQMNFIKDHPEMTPKQLSEEMGISFHKAASMRGVLLKTGQVVSHKSIVEGRRLLAQTCKNCGLFLPAKFYLLVKGKNWTRICSKCSHINDKPSESRSRGAFDLLQEKSKETAYNNGKYWSAEDDDALRKEDGSPFEIAVRIGRTFVAVMERRRDLGLHNARLGDAESQQWLISFRDSPQTTQ